MKTLTAVQAVSLVIVGALSLGAPAHGQVKVVVPEEYNVSCSVCHGGSGTGDGPFAKMMTVKPTDLTTLAKKNDGKFPFLRVMQMIDGRTLIEAHGGREMPVWGQRYTADVGEKYGPYGGEVAVRARILELVYYIQSIQKE